MRTTLKYKVSREMLKGRPSEFGDTVDKVEILGNGIFTITDDENMVDVVMRRDRK